MNKSDKLFMETAEKQQKIIDILLEACITSLQWLQKAPTEELEIIESILEGNSPMKELQQAINKTENN